MDQSFNKPLASWAWLITVSAALSLGLAWLFPSTVIGSLLAFLAACFLSSLFRSGVVGYRHMLAFGVLIHALGFHWLLDTISRLGGFGLSLGLLLFFLFCLSAALQFCLMLFFYKKLPALVHKFGLALALSYTASEFIFPRIFPWYFGHQALPFSQLAQLADIGGVSVLTFLFFYLADTAITILRGEAKRARLYAAAATLLLVFVYGQLRIREISREVRAAGAKAFEVHLVQANISLEDKHNEKLIWKNVERHAALSPKESRANSLILWPETALNTWLPTEIKTLSRSEFSPPPAGSILLFGALSYSRATKSGYNSVVAIDQNSRIQAQYEKQILMPFGEYTPFADIFPFLAKMNRGIVDFAKGKSSAPMTLDFGSQKLRVSALVCYEDIVPRLAWNSSRRDAQILSNFTNDAWFGESVAVKQHHLIASFRAIENRKFLLRATNTGYSGVVHPLGLTTKNAVPFTEGVVRELVVPLSVKSPYYFIGELFARLIVLLTMCLLVIQIVKR